MLLACVAVEQVVMEGLCVPCAKTDAMAPALRSLSEACGENTEEAFTFWLSPSHAEWEPGYMGLLLGCFETCLEAGSSNTWEDA